MIYNIALIVPIDLAHTATELSEQLKSFGSEIVLDGTDFIPHISLYMTEFETSSVAKITAKLGSIAEKFVAFELTAEKFYMNESNYIDIQYVCNKELQELHEEIIDNLKELRLKKPVSRNYYTGPAADKMYQNVLDFGYSIGKELYRPHLTLAKLRTPDQEALESLKWGEFDMSATKIGLYEADKLGACRRLVQAFTLKENN